MFVVLNKITKEFACDDGTLYWDIDEAVLFRTRKEAEEFIEECDNGDDYEIREIEIKLTKP